jgi:hypothetical protein
MKSNFRNIIIISILINISNLSFSQICQYEAIIEKGVECTLPKLTASNQFLNPCIDPFELYNLPLGTKILLDYKPSSCFTFCQQGLEVEILCFSFLTKTEDESLNKQLKVYPVPANDEIRFMDQIPDFVLILDINGKIILTQSMGVNDKITISHLPAGTYFIKAITSNSFKTTSFIKL